MLFYSSESELHMRFQLSASLREHCQLHALSSQAQGCQTPSAFFLSGVHIIFCWLLSFVCCFLLSLRLWLWLCLASPFRFHFFCWAWLCLSRRICLLCQPSRSHTSCLLVSSLFTSLTVFYLTASLPGPDKPFSFVMLSLQNYNGLGLVWRNCNLPYLYACVRGTIKAPHDLNSLKFQRAF